jgi:transcriptional regulator with XRE-family HTH domain
MVTKIRNRKAGRRPQHLYIQEWMEAKGVSDERLAGRLGVARETVTRYRSQQHRLNPDKQAAIAAALGIEPHDLWRPPLGRPSLDAMLKGASDDAIAKLAEFAAIMLKTGS